MDIVVRIGCLSMKCRYFMDIEVRIGCLSMKCRCFMDVEVRIGCPSPRLSEKSAFPNTIGLLQYSERG